MRISIIIVTYNRPNDLKETLQTVLAQTYPIHEIIIVDDSSDDSAKQICEQFQSTFPALIWHRNRSTHAIPDARNQGISLATGDIICFLDDDVSLKNDYLDKITKVFEIHPVALGVTGYDENIIYGGSKAISTFFRLMANSHFRKDQALLLPSVRIVYPVPLTKVIPCQRLIGHNMAYRRKIFDEFRFNPSPSDHFATHDDLEFSFRLQKSYPGTLFATPYARLVHRISPISRNISKMRKITKWHDWKFFTKLIDKTPYNVLYFFYSRFCNFILDEFFLIKQHTAQPNKSIFVSFKEFLNKLLKIKKSV